MGISRTTKEAILSASVRFDQDAIKNSVEAAGEDVLRELPGLTPGQAVVSGDAMNTPALIHVRPRITDHGAESRNIVEEWTESYEQRQREPTESEPADFGKGVQPAFRIWIESPSNSLLESLG